MRPVGLEAVALESGRKRKRAWKIYRGMEQLVARRAHNPKVGGSSPPPATMADNSKELSAFFVVGRLLTDGREGHLAAIVQRCKVHMVREDYVQASG